MNKQKETEIRRLLDRYYEGQTSVDEERRLYSLLTADDDLPEDLKADREVIKALSEYPEVDIPEETEMKLIGRLEQEMARERLRAVWRKRIITSVVVAASLIAAWIGIRMLIPSAHNDSIEPLLTDIGKKETLISDTSITINHLAVASEGNINNQSFSKSLESREQAIRVNKKNNGTTVGTKHSVNEKSNEELIYLSYEEEKELEAANYHVVNDEREAYAIMNAVFLRMDGNIQESDYRIEDISEKYERVATKL